jgi:hypothetical protein
MPRIVPSQVVTFMEASFHPFLSPSTETREGPNAQKGMPESYMGQLEALLTLVEQIPAELITLDGNEYINLSASLAAIRSILKRWEANPKADLLPLPGLSDFNPIVVIHHALAHCPDQFPSEGTTELSFIELDDFRESLRVDISIANRALANNEWKAATVLAGSVVEALLLWALQEQDPATISRAVSHLKASKTLHSKLSLDPETWHLHDYIEVAAALGIIKDDTVAEARIAKDFRNLIHPGRAARLRQTCDRGTAFLAMAAVEHVVRDLTA